MRTRTALMYLLASMAPAVSTAQSLDQKAWNSVWDKFEAMMGNAKRTGDIVHILEYPVPVSWGEGKEPGLWQLQKLVGIIPKESFSLDPSFKDKKLHEVYLSIVGDAILPELSATQQLELDKALESHEKAVQAYEAKLIQYDAKWDKYVTRLTQLGEPINASKRLAFRDENSRLLKKELAALTTATTKVQNLSAANPLLAVAITHLHDAADGALVENKGLWRYDPAEAEMGAIKEPCAPDGAGWEKLKFGKSVTTDTLRTGKWNRNGSYGGSFFGIEGSGDSDSYEKIVTKDTESVSLNFCKLTYVGLSRGVWFSQPILEAIDEGRIKLKEGNIAANKRVLGSEGLIPRLVKGFIVARTVSFEAKLESGWTSEIKRTTSNGGGVRIGPFKIGGGGTRTEFKKENQNNDGSYVRSTDYTVPVVLAVVTETTD